MKTDFLTGSPSILQTVFADHAARHGDRTWCEFEGGVHSYASIDAQANQLAHALRDEMGIVKGDAVAVCMLNCAEYFVAMFAIHRLGGVYVPCSTLYSEDELAYQLEHAEVRAVITDGQNLDLVRRAKPAAETVRAVVVLGKAVGDDTVAFDDALAGRSDALPAEAAAVTADDMAMLMYTSGTTDRPKGVMFNQGNLTSAAHTTAHHFRWTAADRYLHYFPLYHANGGLIGVGPAILVGATVVMIPKFSASTFGHSLVEHDATFVPVNSTHVKMVLRNPETEYDRAHRATRMMLGLSLTPPEFSAFEERFATTLMGTYGLTESLGICVIGEPVGPRRVGSAGRVVRGYTMRVLDEEGNEVGPDEPGEAVVSAHQRHGLAMGYFKDPDKTEEVFGGGELRTGDVVRIDADGYVWFVERKKDMIKRSGFNVAAAEVERVVRTVPGVAEVAVVSTPDIMREEAIVAFVVPEPDATVDVEEVFARCDAELADYKRPQYVELLEALPLNFLGKVERKRLREMAYKYRIESTDPAPVGRRGPLPISGEVSGDA